MNITRDQQDEYAVNSYAKAKQAWESGVMAKEVVPFEVKSKKGLFCFWIVFFSQYKLLILAYSTNPIFIPVVCDVMHVQYFRDSFNESVQVR